MRKLIINADDLGISKEVNNQIEECIRQGVISSSTLMANAPAFEDGVRIAKQYPQISVGVHLNIIEFAPLTNVEVFKKHGIVGQDGNFIEGAIFVAHIDEELAQAVFEEWDAQISKVEEAGIKPSHCDSHQHTHTIVVLQGVLCRVLDKHGIDSVRRKSVPSIRLMLRERKRPSVKLDKSNAVVPQKRSWLYRRLHLFIVKRNNRKWNEFMSHHYTMTESFFPFRSFYCDRDVLRLGGRSAVVELMCHPGHPAYQTETIQLMNKKGWWNDGFRLMSYNEL